MTRHSLLATDSRPTQRRETPWRLSRVRKRSDRNNRMPASLPTDHGAFDISRGETLGPGAEPRCEDNPSGFASDERGEMVRIMELLAASGAREMTAARHLRPPREQ